MRNKEKKVTKIKEKVGDIHLYKLVPNCITLLALCLGVTSIRYALDMKMNIAVALIMIAAVLDGIDGRVARMLNATSKFGAHLDSLSDIVCFGVAPAVVMYLWSLHSIPFKGVGWSIVLFYIACSAIRLARFNTAIEEKEIGVELTSYSVGVPMPGGAFLCIMPLVTSFEYVDLKEYSYLIYLYIALVGILMISRAPTMTLKNMKISKKAVPFVLLAVALIFAFITLEPWITLPIIGLVYLFSIPYTLYVSNKSKA